MNRFFPLLLAAIAFSSGCATNPVTGKKELRFVSEAQEVNIGTQHYARSQQSQGGDYVTDPQVTAYVRKVGKKLAGVSDRKNLPYEFVVLNNSVPNAWALPGGKIAINRGLLTELKSEAELAAVLGHEIVHAAARHGAKAMERGTLLQGGLLIGGIALQDHDYKDIILGAGGVGAQLLNMKYGRNAELESDKYGIKYMAAAGYDPKAAIALQETFVRLSGAKKTGFFDVLFASHPPSQARVEANRETAKLYPDAIFVGEEEYQRAMASILQSTEAYTHMDNGLKALAQKNPQQAHVLAYKALQLEPREAHFHGLAAKAHIMQKNYSGALTELDRAIRKNDHFYEYYLHKGHLHALMGDQKRARANLEKSVKLLPTASAHNSLGKMALAGGNQRAALQHFSVAAVADNRAGQESRVFLARLELPSNPGKYLQAGAGLDGRNFLAVSVQNRSPVPVQNCVIRVAVFSPEGKPAAQQELAVSGVIPPGQSRAVSTTIGPLPSPEALQGRVKVRIMQAEVVQ